MTNGTAANTSQTTPVSLEAMVQAMREIELFTPPEWVLITPDGRVFKGDQRTVARVIFQNLDIARLFEGKS